MWRPATSLNWQPGGLCALPTNKTHMEEFYSEDPEERSEAKTMCYACPERAACLQWALEHRQIWGVWGGRDEVELRRALSVSFEGEELKRRRSPHCPYCAAWPHRLYVSVEDVPGGGRWKTAKVVTCSECGFSWRSRTSANAVELYHAEREERLRRVVELETGRNQQHSHSECDEQMAALQLPSI
jgi:WhiB family redox-sensing transcriptional regulator